MSDTGRESALHCAFPGAIGVTGGFAIVDRTLVRTRRIRSSREHSSLHDRRNPGTQPRQVSRAAHVAGSRARDRCGSRRTDVQLPGAGPRGHPGSGDTSSREHGYDGYPPPRRNEGDGDADHQRSGSKGSTNSRRCTRTAPGCRRAPRESIPHRRTLRSGRHSCTVAGRGAGNDIVVLIRLPRPALPWLRISRCACRSFLQCAPHPARLTCC